MPEPNRCPLCLAHVQERTLAKFGGVCRRCAVHPGSYFKGSLVLLVFGLGWATVPFGMEQQMQAAAENGREFRTIFPFGTLYRAFGINGMRAICWFVSVVALVAAYRSWMHWRTLKKAIGDASS